MRREATSEALESRTPTRRLNRAGASVGGQESKWGYNAMTITHGVCLALPTDDLHSILRRKQFAHVRTHLRRVVVRMQAREIASFLAKVRAPRSLRADQK